MITPYVRYGSSSVGLNGYMGILYTDGSTGNHGWNTSLNTPNAGDDWNNNSAYIGQWRKIALYVDLVNAKTPASISSVYIYNDRTVTGEGIFTNFVITEHATLPTGPVLYTSGTRSDTASLIDLKKTSSIDVGNVNFDSTGQPEFDGSDAYINVPYSAVLNTPVGATYEMVFYPTGHGEMLSRGISDSGTSPDNPRIYWGTNGSIYFDWSIQGQDTYVVTSAADCPASQYSYIACTALPGQQLRVYVNGVEATYTSNVQTLPTPIPNTNHPIVIGGVSWIPRYFAGKIPVVKLHKQALTLSEIKENFKAYKNRINL
jgi:hypothetical protein